MYKLLVADDEAIERRALKFIVENSTLDIEMIEEAYNGIHAVEKASVCLPDIILMDIKMPGMDGIQAMKQIQQFHPNCKVAFLTALDYFEYAKEAIQLGAEDFIVKPATNEQIIEVLNKLISKLEQERQQKQMESKLDQVTRYLKSEFVTSIVNGHIQEKQIEEYLTFMGISLQKGIGVVISLQYDSGSSELRKTMMKKRCMEKVEQFMNQVHPTETLMNCIHSNIYMLGMVSEENDDGYIIDKWRPLFYQLNEFIYEELQIECRIGIGGVVEDFAHASASFSQARLAAYDEQNTGVLVFEEIKENKSSMFIDCCREEQLYESVMQCDKHLALSLTEEVVDWFSQQSEDIQETRLKVYELLMHMYKMAVKEFQIQEGRWTNSFEQLQHMYSKGEIENYVKNQIKDLISQLQCMKTGDPTGRLIEKVCSYIDQNYQEDISLDEMAQKIGFSGSYFSKVFKQYKQMNFVDYVVGVRVAQAEKLLKDPAMNIREISQRIGYSDPNYFTRVFKRVKAMTPTEYRNKKVLES